MYSSESFEKICSSSLLRNTISAFFGKAETEVITRVASYVIKLRSEAGNKIIRIILLPPNGFTANKINETLPHDEVRKAKITILGAVRGDNQRFSRMKNCIKFCYYTKRDIGVVGSYPYAIIDQTSSNYREEIKSTQQSFFSVKENGEGFYHNLVNIVDDWLVLVLEKDLAICKKMNLEPHIQSINSNKKRKLLRELISAISLNGDKVFVSNAALIESVLELQLDEAMPFLIEALNIYETGKHEPCTVYAVILKFGKKDKASVLSFLQRALKQNDAPKYYLEELIEKLS